MNAEEQRRCQGASRDEKEGGSLGCGLHTILLATTYLSSILWLIWGCRFGGLCIRT